MKSWWLILPFILQGGLMVFDEIHFHFKRVLPPWERLGHPLDSITVFACYAFILIFPPTTSYLWTYIALAIFSSVFVTKDEFVHARLCRPGEHWLHSLLFVLHPITFVVAGFWWWFGINRVFIELQALLVIAFTLYQFLYWNVYARVSR